MGPDHLTPSLKLDFAVDPIATIFDPPGGRFGSDGIRVLDVLGL